MFYFADCWQSEKGIDMLSALLICFCVCMCMCVCVCVLFTQDALIMAYPEVPNEEKNNYRRIELHYRL